MKSDLSSILERFGRFIGDKLKSYAVQYIDNHAPAHFRLLPEVHKCPLVGRPIAASTTSLPSYLKDSSDLVCQLNTLSIVPGSYLVTADVTSLYTNFPVKDYNIRAID